MKDGGVGIQLDRALKERVRALERAGLLFRDSTLNKRLEVLRIGTQPFLELVQALLEDATLAVRDLEVAPRDAHALVESQRARECDDRFVRQPLSKVENAEVVVSAGIRRVDSAGERSQDVDLTAVCGCRWAGSCRCAHVLLYAHGAEDGVECLRIRDEQEESVQALHRLFEKEFRLHTKDWTLDLWRVVAQRLQRLRGRAGRQRWRREHQTHVEEFTESCEVRASENVARFFQRRLFERAETLRCSSLR